MKLMASSGEMRALEVSRLTNRTLALDESRDTEY
jgi:hypothetical protein